MNDNGWTLEIADKILSNFNLNTGLFSTPIYTKLFCFVFMALSCLGTKGVKNREIHWGHIIIAAAVGIILFFFNDWILALDQTVLLRTIAFCYLAVLHHICTTRRENWIFRRDE